MLVETHLDKEIDAALRVIADAETLKHVPSGKLSASGLMEPLQWQVLKALQAGTRVVDDYVLRKFVRGKQVEDWVTPLIPGAVEFQKFLTYRNVVGYADAIVDTKDYNHKIGIIPHEVKSVTNAKFKRLVKRGEADEGHKLQGGLYALATGATHFAIDYVASDDLRIMTFIYPITDMQQQIDQIIDAYDAQMAKQIVPVFEPRYKWQADKNYNKFPEWSDLTEKECQIALNYHYPGAWEKYAEKTKTI